MPTREQLVQLYDVEMLSTPEIAARLNVSLWHIVYLMRRYDIPRRLPSETRRIQFLRSPRSYEKIDLQTRNDQELWCAGLMLYWAEGAKRYKHTVDFANSDPKALIMFIAFLRKLYKVREDKIRIYLYCYSNQNLANIIEYWSKLLTVPSSQFSKPYVRKNFNPDKIDLMPHGLVHIRYHDSRLLVQILEDIDIMYHRIMHC